MTRRVPTSIRLLPVLVAAMALLLVFLARPAAAHLEPDPTQVPAGEMATVAFTVEHGCEASSTVRLDMQVPVGLREVQPADKPGWTSSIANGVVTWTGGPLPTAEESSFVLNFRAPDQATSLKFKVIQKCEVGEIAWIGEQQPGGEEPENPIPTVEVVGTATVTTAAPTTVLPTVVATVPATTATTTLSTTSDAITPTTHVVETATEDSSSSSTVPIIVALIAIALVTGVTVVTVNRTRRTRKP